MVPQDQAWEATHDLAATQRRGNQEIASLLTGAGRQVGLGVAAAAELGGPLRPPSTPPRGRPGARAGSTRSVTSMSREAFRPGRTCRREIRSVAGLCAGVHRAAHVQRGRCRRGRDRARHPNKRSPLTRRLRWWAEDGPVPCSSSCLAAPKPTSAGSVTGERRTGARPWMTSCWTMRCCWDQGVLLSEPSTRLEGMAGASLWGRR